MIFDTQKLFLTTTLPYANSVPHIGHTLEFIQADALARHFRKENDLIFNIGLDEHGSKIYEKAQELNITPQQLVDDLSIKWKEFCSLFQISYNNFYRTSDPKHHEAVHKFWNICLEKGDIYKKSYTGKYCSGCESFKTETDLVDGKCQDHPTTEIKTISEENYFFKLSNYKEYLTKYVSETEFVQPYTKRDELINIIDIFDEISISRLRSVLPWGVQVPNDPEQTVYVWFDALTNYIVAAGWNVDDSKFNQYWNDNVIQICGPDNLRFQGQIWQSFLASAGIKPTTKLLVHGTVLDSEGKKISKSVGNVIDPIEILSQFGLDPVRFYTLCGLNTYTNGSWDNEELVTTWNALANSWGNLIARVLHLTDKFGIQDGTNELESEINQIVPEVIQLWNDCEIKLAIQKTNELVSIINKWVTDNEPWKSKNQVDIGVLYRLLTTINDLYDPVIPESCQKVREAITDKKKAIIFTKL